MLGEELVDVSLDDGGLAGAEFSDHQDLVQVLFLLHTSCLQSTKKSINRMCTVQELILILSILILGCLTLILPSINSSSYYKTNEGKQKIKLEINMIYLRCSDP